MDEKPENAPEHCPGTNSEQAGKSAACEGCPNQTICATAPKGPDPAIQEIRDRLQNVKRKILVLSGKGGVGKSTFSAQLAYFLASKDLQVGLLDVDICGPSIPKIMGLEGEEVHQSNAGWSPVYVEDNLAVMSIGFLLPDPDDAVIWRGPKKNGMIKQFLKDVNWGDLDYLVIDTPPGTSDEHLSIVTYLKEAGVDGAVIVTTPQEVALLDVRKEINFCKKVNIPILGVVENMSGFVCPKCTSIDPHTAQNQTEIFPPTTGGALKMCTEMGLTLLGRIPIDPNLARCCDLGLSYLESQAGSPGAQAFRHVIDQIINQTPTS